MRWSDRLVLSALAVDGLIVGVVSVAFLTAHAGSVPVPITALLGAVLTAGLLRIASDVTAGPARYGPLLGWVLPVLAGLVGGPGGDVLLVPDWRTLLLVVVGLAVPVITSWVWRGPARSGRGHGA